ncbi:MAG TPA: TetR/AcrR family transcriptional regulator [Actinomycetota bacterium]|jgi:AcrR family transcriptional regulator|nr:TetR/AcrR family transcriptional regulator [Actinomycetota bacterium]
MTRRRELRTHEDRLAYRAEILEQKRQRFLEAAVGVLRRDGPAVSMREIAREAGVTKPIIYRVFGDREGLTKAMADRFADELASDLQLAIQNAPDDRRAVAGAIDAYLGFIEREPSVIRFLITRSLEAMEETGVAMSGFVWRVGQIITQAIGEAMRERGLDSGVAEPWSYAIVGAVHMAGDWWLERQTMPRERLVEILTQLVWDGMARFDTPLAAAGKKGTSE